MALDPNTFGGSDAAMILVEKLNRIDDPKLTRQVSAFLTYTFTGLSRLSSIDDDAWFKRFVVLFRKHQIDRVAFHEDIDTYIKNIVTSTSKDWARSNHV